MAITINWINNSVDVDSIEIYRSEGGFNINDPGVPIDVVPTGTTTYTDESAAFTNNYSYSVAAVKGTVRKFSAAKTVESLRRRGPGGNVILKGDTRLGYMGEVPYHELPDFSTSIEQPILYTVLYNTVWHKFIRKNKIFYIGEKGFATVSIGLNLARNIFNTHNLVDGIEWSEGVDTTNWKKGSKSTIFEHNSFKFRFRAPRGLPDDWNGDTTPETMKALALDPETEFNELFQPLLRSWIIPNKLGSIKAKNTLTKNIRYIVAEQTNTGGSFIRCNDFDASDNMTTDGKYKSSDIITLASQSLNMLQFYELIED